MPSLVSDPLQQLVKGDDELLNAVVLKRRDDVVVVDADRTAG